MTEHYGFSNIRRNLPDNIQEIYPHNVYFFISVQTVGTSRLYLSYICLVSASGN